LKAWWRLLRPTAVYRVEGRPREEEQAADISAAGRETEAVLQKLTGLEICSC